MGILFYIVLATFTISLISFAGALTISINKKIFSKLILGLVGLSAGALLGGAFLHLLPESLEHLDYQTTALIILFSYLVHFIVEKFFHWHHCHDGECDEHSFGYMNLVGDAIHNFLDGFIIAAAFLVDINLGVLTTLAIALHEIPQELGDFSVLIHAGISKTKALFYNFGVALTSMLGGVLGYLFASSSEVFVSYLLPFAVGSFIYIAASDLTPELRKDTNLKQTTFVIFMFVLGVSLLFLTGDLVEHGH